MATVQPTASTETAPSTIDSSAAIVPLVKNQGKSGMTAPIENITNDDPAACHGFPVLPGLQSELFACVDLERDLRVAHDRLGDATCVGLLDAAKPVDGRELSGLVLRVALQLATLDLQLALQEFRLRGHRDVLPRRHREGAGDQARQPGEQDDRRDGVRAGNPEDQRDVGEQAVADAEDGGACGTTLEIAVVGLLVRLTDSPASSTGATVCAMEKVCRRFEIRRASLRMEVGSRRRGDAARSSGWRGSR